MINFDKYTNYVRLAFKEYDRCIVKQSVKNYELEIITIIPKERSPKPVEYGELAIKFDQDAISFFGDFMPDDYIDAWPDNIWEKYTEKEIYEILDKKIAEYKNYIDNGYFFTFYDMNNEWDRIWPYVYTGDIDKVDYEEVYADENSTKRANYAQIKSVTVTNFYGDIIVENKILH